MIVSEFSPPQVFPTFFLRFQLVSLSLSLSNELGNSPRGTLTFILLFDLCCFSSLFHLDSVVLWSQVHLHQSLGKLKLKRTLGEISLSSQHFLERNISTTDCRRHRCCWKTSIFCKMLFWCLHFPFDDWHVPLPFFDDTV